MKSNKYRGLSAVAVMAALGGMDIPSHPKVVSTGTNTGRLSGKGTKVHNTSREQQRRMRQQAKKDASKSEGTLTDRFTVKGNYHE